MSRWFRSILVPFLLGAAMLPACTMNQVSTKELVDQLDVSDENVRVEAVWLLASRGPDAIDPLLTALNDHNPHVRGAAALNLGLLGDRSAIPELRRHLSDPEEIVRSSVHDALQLLERDKEIR